MTGCSTPSPATSSCCRASRTSSRSSSWPSGSTTSSAPGPYPRHADALRVLLLAVIYFASSSCGLDLIGTILEYAFQYGVIAALIVFQPELRSALARLGQSRMLRLFNKMEESAVVEELVEGVERLSRAKIGGIIAIQREVGLDEYADTGTRIQARVSADIIISIFAPTGRSTTAPCWSAATPSSPPA
jgi:hypothetical protein